MAIDALRVREWVFQELKQVYTHRDTILYALALGYGAQSDTVDELSFVYERGLQAVPTFATNLCHPGLWISDPATGIDASKAVHGEHFMRFHATLPPAATVRAKARVVDLVDKGPGRGALLIFERLLYEEVSGKLLASIEQRTLLRGDGGFSGASPPTAQSVNNVDKVAVSADLVPPDHSVDIATLPQASLIYRLSADPNPLHVDPQFAEAAGYPKPILHGLCTYGIAARAIIRACCGNRADQLAGLGARFSSPVYPGETIRTEVWRTGPNELRFQCRVPDRNVTVISGGTATLRTA